MVRKALFSAVCALFLFASLASVSAQQPTAPLPGVATTSDAGTNGSYTLGSGDKVRVNVFGQADLQGEYVIDGAGFVQLPLIGQTKAAGLTIAEFQKQVTEKLGNGYLVNPNVDVEVVTYRPFYIIGEVRTPGQYAYINGMSVLNAVALAGGYTDRADKSEIYIRRNGSSKEVEYPGDETTKVNPGDIVRVSERFF
jgi:protein involved in polysaccharide export with SLBB domain